MDLQIRTCECIVEGAEHVDEPPMCQDAYSDQHHTYVLLHDVSARIRIIPNSISRHVVSRTYLVCAAADAQRTVPRARTKAVDSVAAACRP